MSMIRPNLLFHPRLFEAAIRQRPKHQVFEPWAFVAASARESIKNMTSLQAGRRVYGDAGFAIQ